MIIFLIYQTLKALKGAHRKRKIIKKGDIPNENAGVSAVQTDIVVDFANQLKSTQNLLIKIMDNQTIMREGSERNF